MLPPKKTSNRDRGSGPIGQKLHPGAGIFMSYDGCHRPRKHGMSPREGSVEAAMDPEPAVACSFFRTFATSRKLHWGVNQESVSEGFEFQFAGLFRVPVLGFDSVGPQADEHGTGRIETHVREVATRIKMGGGQ